MNGAELLVRTLAESGIDVCFTNPGTSEMHFVAALDRLDSIYCILALQENVATGAADGYARMAGIPAATLLHTGPGLGNGLANIHNAKKARTPMVNIVGDHATYHVEYDAPLTADIEAIAKPVSHWVETVPDADDVGPLAAKAVQAAKSWPGNIATLILPADAAWGEGRYTGDALTPDAPKKVNKDNVTAAMVALASGRRCALFMTGEVLTEPGLTLAGKIKAKTGAELFSQTSNRRVDRGAGRVPVKKLPYPVDQALETLKDVETLICVGTKRPVSFFAYPEKPSLMAPEGCEIISLASAEQNTVEALEMLVAALEAEDAEPELAAPAQPVDVDTLQGEITPEVISKALAAVMPEDAIISDESITTGRAFYPDTVGAPKHTWLQITGGSIGDGLPMGLGAAIACPDRQVIVLQSDGSAMYTNQALWTMAREGVDVLVLLFNNGRYRILDGEMKGVGVEEPGHVADGLFSLGEPPIDWCKMAESMGVAATRVEKAEDLVPAMRHGIEKEGPHLVEIVF